MATSEPSGGSRAPRSTILDRSAAELLGLEPGAPVPGGREDVGLRFYAEVLGLRHLHYGLWAPEDALDLGGLRAAQERYLERLIALLPDPPARVLDAGCGAGGNASVLLARGFEVEGLSPDPYHGERFRAATGRPFHQQRFQDFVAAEPFDAVLMSESAQYVPLDSLFTVLRRTLVPAGTVVLSDYFNRVEDSSYETRSGHALAAFEAELADSGFSVVEREDITDAVLPTLDLACRMLEGYVLPTTRLALTRLGQKRPWMLRLLSRLARKQLAKADRRKSVLDRDLFAEKKRYLVFRLRAPG